MASVDTGTGEFQEKRLAHPEEAKKFYRGLAAAGQPARIGMKAINFWLSEKISSVLPRA